MLRYSLWETKALKRIKPLSLQRFPFVRKLWKKSPFHFPNDRSRASSYNFWTRRAPLVLPFIEHMAKVVLILSNNNNKKKNSLSCPAKSILSPRSREIVTEKDAFIISQLKIPVFFTPFSSNINIRELKQRWRRRQRGRQKSNGFILAKQQLCTGITLFCTFLCRHCTTTTWKCLISS